MTNQVAATKFDINGKCVEITVAAFARKSLMSALCGEDKDTSGYDATVTIDGVVVSVITFDDQFYCYSPKEALEEAVTRTVNDMIVKPAIAAAK